MAGNLAKEFFTVNFTSCHLRKAKIGHFYISHGRCVSPTVDVWSSCLCLDTLPLHTCRGCYLMQTDKCWCAHSPLSKWSSSTFMSTMTEDILSQQWHSHLCVCVCGVCVVCGIMMHILWATWFWLMLPVISYTITVYAYCLEHIHLRPLTREWHT